MPEPKQRKIATAKDVRNKRTYFLQVGEFGLFEMKRVDLPTMMWEGIIPTPLLAAVGKLEKMRGKLTAKPTDPWAAMDDLSREDRDQIMELMRRAAVAAVLTPKLTHDPEAVSDDVLDVADLNTTDLIVIWKAVLGEAGVVVLSPDEAATFRQSKSPVPAEPVHDSDDVQPPAVVVDLPPRTEHAAPQAVEFVGGR